MSEESDVHKFILKCKEDEIVGLKKELKQIKSNFDSRLQDEIKRARESIDELEMRNDSQLREYRYELEYEFKKKEEKLMVNVASMKEFYEAGLKLVQSKEIEVKRNQEYYREFRKYRKRLKNMSDQLAKLVDKLYK